MAEQPAFVITSVHGTFARRSKWTSPDSDFVRSVRSLLPGDVSVYSHTWSGANSQKARRQASTELKQKLIDQFERHPAAAHFVIGHSHGGNVAMYALDDDSVQSRVNGVLCVNTPFITVTTRHTQNMILFLIISFSLCMMIFLSLFFVGFVVAGIAWLLSPERVVSENPGQLAIAMVFMALIFWLFWRLFNLRTRIDNYFQRKRDHLIETTRLPTIKRTPIFCLWSCSDEVYGFFSLLEGLANLPYILMHAFFSIAVFMSGAAYLLWFYTLFPWSSFLGMSSELATNPSAIAYNTLVFGFVFILLVSGPVFVGFGAVFQYLISLFLLAIPLNFILRIIPVGISAKDLMSSFFVRLSFTFVPLTAQHVEFREVMLPLRFLNHSAAYRDAESIRIIADWMRDKSRASFPGA